jgi:hypothetical protein
MNSKTLKKLSAEFAEFLYESATPEDIECEVSAFWFAKFGVNNSEREAELLSYYMNN